MLLPILILSHNSNFVKYITLPFRLIKKLSSARALPFLIIFFNYIYVFVFCLRICVFYDIIGGKVQNTDILGFDFNITTANSLTVLSFLSIIIVLKKRNDSEINNNRKINWLISNILFKLSVIYLKPNNYEKTNNIIGIIHWNN